MKLIKKKRDNQDILYEVLLYIRFLVLVSLVFVITFTFVFRHELVVGASMYPTLKDGEHVFVNIASSYLSDLDRFDVVVVLSHDRKELWVKRIIGLPGENIRYKDDILYVNGKKVQEPFLDKRYMERKKKQKKMLNFTNDFESRQLRNDEYLLLGDNRPDSMDSRSVYVGPFKKDQVIGKGVVVITPLIEMRYVSSGRK